ncbi:MAG: AMP-binding protein [Cyclobacteriaceae bacterium]
MMKSTIYIEDRYCISSEELSQIDRAASIPYFAELKENEQLAIRFAWQWLRGDASFEQATSGSTGEPKTITLGRDQMMASARMTLAALQLTDGHTSLLCLHPQYIGGKMMIVRSLLAGMNLVITDPSSTPLQHLPFLPDFAAMVPLQIQTLLEQEQADRLNQMQAIIIGGAPVSRALENMIAQLLTLPVYSTYGMTETVSHIALRKLTQPQASAFFHTLGDTQITTDARGCLQVKGSITQQQWITTNDLIELHDQQQFRWLGRHDFVINSGGVKISPEAVEAALEPLLASAGFEGRFLVTSLPDERLGERVILLIEGARPTTALEKNVLRQAALALPLYQVPKAIYSIPAFAETPTGKIQRQATRQFILKQR